MMGLIILVGIFQSWNIALSIFNMCLISAVMTMGANVQWGYAGLINFGLMGYAALGGLAAVLISVDPVQEAWRAGGFDILMCLWLIIVMVLAIRFILKNFEKSKLRTYGISAIIVAGIVIIRIRCSILIGIIGLSLLKAPSNCSSTVLCSSNRNFASSKAASILCAG